MMVEGFINDGKFKIREGHWAVGGVKTMRIKIDGKPQLDTIEEITLRYGTKLVPTKVKLVAWDEKYSEVFVEVLNA
jgi:hypothetical protein